MNNALFACLLVFVICFSAIAEDKPKPKIEVGQRWRVTFNFPVANDSGHLDHLTDLILARNNKSMNEMVEKGQIQRTKERDVLKVMKVYNRQLGAEFDECRLYRNGKNLGTVWVISHFLQTLCEKAK